MSRKVILLIVIVFTIISSCEKTTYLDRVEYEYKLDTLLINQEYAKDYVIKIVSSKDGSDFPTLTSACGNLTEGKYILYLQDSLYEERVTANIDVKAGWIIKGRGMNGTKVVFYDEGLENHYNLNIVGDSRICDLHLVSVQTPQSNHYCIHMDDPTVQNLQFRCENVMMETVIEDDNAPLYNNNMLVLGIGTEVNPESWTQLKGSNETNF